MNLMIRFILFFPAIFVMTACLPVQALPTTTPSSVPSDTPAQIPPTLTQVSTPSPAPSATPAPPVPNFEHVVIIMFENKEFGTVIGRPQMPTFNRLAREYTLLTQYYAIMHPSLPNYIALISGDTYGIRNNCSDCFINEASLPDLIENSGRTWKTYQEDMPRPCYVGDTHIYVQKHNPFIYFDPIRLDQVRCERSIVPLDDLQKDIVNGTLADFIFITPNLCNDAHDCGLEVADAWLGWLLGNLIPALEAESPSYLVVMLFEEGQGNHSCCGLPAEAGGRVPVVLLSPLARRGFEDATPYTHYSLLKTISTAWGLPLLGNATDDEQALIVEPWK